MKMIGGRVFPFSQINPTRKQTFPRPIDGAEQYPTAPLVGEGVNYSAK